MDLQNPALTVGLAMAAGVLAQAVARHLLMPGIVLLLAVGVLLGPDVAGLIQPGTLGPALRMLVGFAVAVILFDGGMNLDIGRLRREALAIRRLVTYGAIIMAIGGALAAHYIMGWDWRLSILFGTLVIVTGPTVVTPLVRRLRLREPVSTILEAEGVLIDPIGALIAVVALEVLYASETSVAAGFGTWAIVLGTGAVIGLVGGVILVLLLRPRGVVPAGLENILVLSLVIALFQVSEAIRHESGLTTVVVAGMVVGNVKTRVSRELLDFKEQLTVLMIGLLFVLLAADVRLEDVVELGWPAILTVLALMLIVRPVQVWLCTIGSKLSWKERTFIGLMAPRGIVAAAVASLFAAQLTERGLDGDAFRALVFLVIALTVTLHGLTGGFLARWLGVRRPSGNGYVFLGGNSLARALGSVLRDDGHEILMIDSNVDTVITARAEGFQVINGQGLQPTVLSKADPDSRVGCIAITPNEDVNLLFAKRVREETRVPALFVALQREQQGIPIENVHEARAVVLFGRSRRLDEWTERLEHNTATLERWSRTSVPDHESEEKLHDVGSLLVIAVRRRGRMRPYDDEVQLGSREEIAVIIDDARRDTAEEALRARGWAPVRAPVEATT